MASWADIQRGIFAGESGGDYDALYGFRNRSGPFQGTRVSQMPISDVLAFTNPSGPYAQSVKSEIGRVATPVGAYQVVGSTLRDAVDALGLDPSQTFDQATQDKIGQWILSTQGTGAWDGYKGPRMSTSNSPQSIAADTMAALGMRGREMPQQQPMGLLEQLGIQKMGSGGPQGDVPFYQRDRFKDTAGALALALNDMQLRPGQGVAQNVSMGRQRRDASRTAAWLLRQPGGAEFAQMIEAGADPAQVLMAYRQAAAPVAEEKTAAQKNYEFLISQGVDPQAAMTRAFQGGVNVNLGDRGPQVGTIPQGYQMVQDPQTGAYRMEPIPGGPEDTSKFEQAGAENQAAGAANVLEVLEGLASDVASDPLLTGIFGAIASSVPGTGAYDAARTADIIRANLAFDALTAMRKESPTGGALGAVSERELQLLESQISSLDLRQSKAKVLESVNRIRNEYVRILRKAYETGDPARLDAMFGGRPSFLGEKPEDKVLTYDPTTGEFK